MVPIFALCLLLALHPGHERQAAPNFEPVLRIGRIDRSAADLKAVAIDESVEVYAGRDVIAPEEWPTIQPGVNDRWAGSQSYTYAFAFDPPHRAGTYRLRIGFIGAHPYSPPRLKVSVGQEIWSTYDLPRGRQLNPRDGMIQELAPAVLEMDVPASTLPGDGPVRVSIEQVGPSSWAYYDGIEVLHSPEAVPAAVTELNVTSLPMVFRAEADGVPGVAGGQAVRVRALLRGAEAPVTARIELPGEAPLEVTLPTEGSRVLNGPVEATVSLPRAEAPRTVPVTVSAGGVTASGTFEQRPVREFELYVVPQAHFDNGYTHTQAEALDRNIQNLEGAMDLAERFENFSWSNESAYIVQQWWATASERDRQRFVELVRAGRIGFDGAYANVLTGLCTAEALHRTFYFAGNFAHTHRVDLKTATMTDTPSYVWSLPQILAGSGIEFLSLGLNPHRSEWWRLGQDLYQNPVEWEGPDGSRVVTMIHRHYSHAGHAGLTESLEAAERGVPAWLAAYDRPEYRHDVVHLHGAYSDNVLLDERLPNVVAAWNAKYEWPRIRLSTNQDFFERLRETAGDELPVIRGDAGAYWEDGAASSAAPTAVNRDNARRLSLAETLLAGLHAQGKLAEYPGHEIGHAWENVLLYDEHTWGAAWSITQPDHPGALEQFRRKAQYAADAKEQVDALMALAAEHLPAARHPERTASAERVQVEGPTITSPYYRLELDPETGHIASMTDLETGRELVEQPAAASASQPANQPARTVEQAGFGQIIYASKQRNRPPNNQDLAVGSALSSPRLLGIDPIPGGLRVRYAHEVFPKLEMLVRLDGRAGRIEVEYDLEKQPVYELESLYFAFPFAMREPELDYEVGGAVVRAGRDWLPQACLDWFSVQDFVRLRDPATGASVVLTPLDAPLVEFGDLNTHKWLKELPIRDGRIFSYALNNYWETNYKASQGGPMRFRFAITSGENLTNAQAMAFGTRWSDDLRAAVAAMVSVDHPDARLLAFKRAEDGDGYIVRLWETAGRAATATVKVPALPGGVGTAERVNLVELPETDEARRAAVRAKDGAVAVELKPWEIVTVRVRAAE